MRKRHPAEREKSLLALLDTCVAWPDTWVSLRKLHTSSLLKENRQTLSLPSEVSLSTILNHLHELASLCRMENLLFPEEKRQISQFYEGAKERLERIRPLLVGLIRLTEQRHSK